MTGDDGGDSASSCATGLAECDGKSETVCETDTRSSAEHCGACGHACGGTATCQNGRCSLEKLTETLPRPFGLALAGQRLLWHQGDYIRGCRAADCASSTAIMADVNGSTLANGIYSPRQIAVSGSTFYFSQCVSAVNECGVAACDITGCKLTGSSFVGTNENHRAQVLVGGPGAIYTYQGIDGLYRTDPTAKTVTYADDLYKVQEGLQGFYIDAQRAIYVNGDASQITPIGGVYVCPASGCTGAATRLLPPPVKHLAYTTGTILTTTGGSNASSGSVIACAETGCDSVGTVLATAQAYISDIVADGNDVYWVTAGTNDVTTNGAPLGTLMHCTLPSCAGGPDKIAEALLNPVSVLLDADYLYVLTRGEPSASNGSIVRMRR